MVYCDQVLNKLREAEILLNQGNTLAVVWKKIGVSDYTYYRWRKEYGGMRIEQAKRLKKLEQENSRLKRLVADLSLDNAILKEASRGTLKPVQETSGDNPRVRVIAYLREAGMPGIGPNKGYSAA